MVLFARNLHIEKRARLHELAPGWPFRCEGEERNDIAGHNADMTGAVKTCGTRPFEKIGKSPARQNTNDSEMEFHGGLMEGTDRLWIGPGGAVIAHHDTLAGFVDSLERDSGRGEIEGNTAARTLFGAKQARFDEGADGLGEISGRNDESFCEGPGRDDAGLSALGEEEESTNGGDSGLRQHKR